MMRRGGVWAAKAEAPAAARKVLRSIANELTSFGLFAIRWCPPPRELPRLSVRIPPPCARSQHTEEFPEPVRWRYAAPERRASQAAALHPCSSNGFAGRWRAVHT